jgi:hypothetical protein
MRAVALKTAIGVLLASVIVLVAQLAGSEPVRKKILDQLDIQTVEGATVIHISLTSPVRYIRHFPYVSGEELRIKILLFDVSSDNRKARFGREALVPFDAGDLPLEEVVYEGDMEGGPYLTLLFSRSVDFGVQQGTDSRSIVVYVKKPAADAPCIPVQEPDRQ